MLVIGGLMLVAGTVLIGLALIHSARAGAPGILFLGMISLTFGFALAKVACEKRKRNPTLRR